VRIGIIVNRISRKKKFFYRHVYPALARNSVVDVWETEAAGHATALAREAANQGYPVLLSAGGDGTLHQVVNGIRQSRCRTWPTLGVIPLGTGNDFARLANMHLTKTNWGELLQQPVHAVDLGVIRHGAALQNTTYFINACSLGLGPEVVQRLANGSRVLGPFLTYVLAIARSFVTNRPLPLSITTDRFSWQGNMRVCAVANGQSFGASIYIAPQASVTDGCLNTFIAGEVSLLDFLKYLGSLKNGIKISDPRLHYGTALRAGINSLLPLWMEAEGELVGQVPAEITVLPSAQPFIAQLGQPPISG
jgi:YegS/Rv2252/BmrU family lipid kinase